MSPSSTPSNSSLPSLILFFFPFQLARLQTWLEMFISHSPADLHCLLPQRVWGFSSPVYNWRDKIPCVALIHSTALLQCQRGWRLPSADELVTRWLLQLSLLHLISPQYGLHGEQNYLTERSNFSMTTCSGRFKLTCSSFGPTFTSDGILFLLKHTTSNNYIPVFWKTSSCSLVSSLMEAVTVLKAPFSRLPSTMWSGSALRRMPYLSLSVDRVSCRTFSS